MVRVTPTCYISTMSHKTTGDLLKEYRKNKLNGMSVREAAKQVGIHYTSLSRIENNVSDPVDSTLNLIAEKYGLNEDEKADLFFSAKMTPTMEDIVRTLGATKTAEIIYRRSIE